MTGNLERSIKVDILSYVRDWQDSPSSPSEYADIMLPDFLGNLSSGEIEAWPESRKIEKVAAIIPELLKDNLLVGDTFDSFHLCGSYRITDAGREYLEPSRKWGAKGWLASVISNSMKYVLFPVVAGLIVLYLWSQWEPSPRDKERPGDKLNDSPDEAQQEPAPIAEPRSSRGSGLGVPSLGF